MFQVIPGSVVRVLSRRYAGLVYHWGVVTQPDPYTGEERVIHSEKGSVVRATSVAEFVNGGTMEVMWVPQTLDQQHSVLQRMHSLEGQPYDVFTANCEHVVSWALTGKAKSPQLAYATAIFVGLGLALALTKARAA